MLSVERRASSVANPTSAQSYLHCKKGDPEVADVAFTTQQLAEWMPDARELLSDEPEMESTRHYQQLALLVSHLEWYWRGRDDFFISANLTVYYTHE